MILIDPGNIIKRPQHERMRVLPSHFDLAAASRCSIHTHHKRGSHTHVRPNISVCVWLADWRARGDCRHRPLKLHERRLILGLFLPWCPVNMCVTECARARGLLIVYTTYVYVRLCVCRQQRRLKLPLPAF